MPRRSLYSENGVTTRSRGKTSLAISSHCRSIVAAVRIWHVQWNIVELIHYIPPSLGALRYNLWYIVIMCMKKCNHLFIPVETKDTQKCPWHRWSCAHPRSTLWQCGYQSLRETICHGRTPLDMSFIKCHLIGFGLSMFTTFQKLPWFVPLINSILIAGVSVVSCRISQNGCITL